MKPFALLMAAIGPATLVGILGRHSGDSAWVARLGWVLIHTVWQFALVALVAAVIHWSLRRRSARVRYVSGVVSLGAMAIASGVTFCVVDVSRPPNANQTRIAPQRTSDEMLSRDASPLPRSTSDESKADQLQTEQGGAQPSGHGAAPLAAVGEHIASRVAPQERSSLSWIATLRSTLAPRLPLLVSLWFAGLALFSLRPVWGLWTQLRLRRVGLAPVPASVAQCLNDLASRLGLRRTVAIAQSACVGVPMTVGYLRPLILLPARVLTGLSAAQLEALLAHELAHVRRHDWLVNAFQLLVETIFFYHPAVWWLSRLIRQERENCCDDLAVSLVGDRGTVGRMLLALEELRQRTPGLTLAATGGNLLTRVRRMVANARSPEPADREWLFAATLLLLAGFGVAAWAVSAGAGDSKTDTRTAAKTLNLRRITGRVVDSKGQPVQAARLWWVVLNSYPNQRQFTIEGASDAQGRFALEAPAAWKPRQPGRVPADMLWVFAAGKDLKVIRATDGLSVDGKESGLVISLATATQTDYEIRDEQGHPIVGVVVQPWHFHTPRQVNEPLPIDLRDLLRRTTDQLGRVRLSSLPRDLFYGLEVVTTALGTQHQRLDGEDEASPYRKIMLRRVGSIEGRLTADDPQWVRGVKLLFQTERRSWGARFWDPVGEKLVETDQQGHFGIPAIAVGTALVRVVSQSTESPVAPRLPTDPIVVDGETSHVDIPMEKLVRVKGSIRTDDTQAPVEGAEILVQYGEGFQADDVTSDRQGNYEASVLPGLVHTSVISIPRQISGHYTQVGDPWKNRIQVGRGNKKFDLPPIVLAATEVHSGTLIDRDGHVIGGARVHGICGNRRYGFAESNDRGEFSLQLPKKPAMTSYEVWIGGRARDRMMPSVVQHEPLTLQVDLAASDKNRGPSKQKLAPATLEKRSKTEDRKPTASAAP